MRQGMRQIAGQSMRQGMRQGLRQGLPQDMRQTSAPDPLLADAKSLIDTLPSLRLDRSRHVSPQIFEALRELIISVELEPGQVLPRLELAQHYGVSQTPIRDALTRLGEEGLVDIFAQHATVVSQISIVSAQQAHFLRRSIELELLRSLARAPTAAIKALSSQLRGAILRQSQALEQGDFRLLALADRAFHQAMYEAANVGQLWDLVRQRSGHIDRLRSLHLPTMGKAQAIIRDHKAIVRALDQGDAEAGADALNKHLSGTLSFVDEIRARYPDFVID